MTSRRVGRPAGRRIGRHAGRALVDRWRSTGADLPGGDPTAGHGAEMEGYFWRITDVDTGTVVLALCGVNRDGDGRRWATVAASVHPDDVTVHDAVQQGVADHPHRLDVRAGTTLQATASRLLVDLDGIALDVTLGPSRATTGVLPGGGLAGIVPGLGQYWHPHLFGAPVRGTLRTPAGTRRLDGAVAYAEKNWGRGFPERWWWGQADGFARPDLTVAFGGGRLAVGRAGPAGDVTGIVCAVGGHTLRLAPPFARVRTEVDEVDGVGTWRVHGRGPRTEVTIEGDGSRRPPAVLPVPLPAERRNVMTDREHLAATLHLVVRRDGRTLVDDTSHLAALEVGSRPDQAAAEASCSRTRGATSVA